MRIPFAPVATVIVAAAVATSATAQQSPSREIVENGKRQGLVGEQSDGMLGFVTGQAAVDLRAAVGEINEGRARVYAQAAQRAGTSAEAAGQAAGRQLTARVPAGQFYRTPEGEWRRR